MATKEQKKAVADALEKTEKEKQKKMFEGVADKEGEWREWGPEGDDNA